MHADPTGRDIRWQQRLGGGGLLDVGYYPVRALTELFGAAPTVVEARAWLRDGVDRRLVTAVDTLSDAEAVVRNLQSMSPAMTPLLLRIVHLVPAGKASTPRRRHAYGRIIE